MTEPSVAPPALLGICIPTYKRPELLRLCIRSIIRSAGREPVPIFVSDDAADDTNRAVLEELQHAYPALHVSRNARNLGIDANILAVVSGCTAQFAWLMGEDDLLLPEAVPAVLDRLRRTPAANFLCVNYAYVANDHRTYLRPRVLPVERDVAMPRGEFFEQLGWGMGFIGACVVRRAAWRPREDYIGSYFAHVATIHDLVAEQPVEIIATPLVLNRAENRASFTWSASTLDVVLSWHDTLSRIGAAGTFSVPRAQASSERLFRPFAPTWLMSARAEGVYGWREYRELLRGRIANPWRRLACAAVAWLPPTFCRAVKGVYLAVTRTRRRPVPPASLPPA